MSEPEKPILPPIPILHVALQRFAGRDFAARVYDADGCDLAHVTARRSASVDVVIWTIQQADAAYPHWEYFRAVEQEIARRWGAL